jgi:hypothetical protein
MPESNFDARAEAGPELMTRKAPLGNVNAGAPSTLNAETRSVGVVLATENPVFVYDWDYGRVSEVLLMSGAVLPADGQVPLLDSHNSWSVESQLGSLRNFAVHGKELRADAMFSTAAEDAFTKVKEGHLRDVSVGYKVHKRVFVPEKTTQVIDGRTFTGPVKVVTSWEVKEGSFTPIGADKHAKARSAPGSDSARAVSDNENREGNPMPQMTDTNNGQAGRADINSNAPANTPQPDAANSAPGSENDRRADNGGGRQAPPERPASAPVETDVRAEDADMLALGRRHDCLELAENAIRAGTSLAAFRAQVLDRIAERSDRHAPGHRASVETGRDESEKFRAAASDALCLRAGSRFAPKTSAPGADELRGFSLKEMARDSLRRSGKPTHGDMDMIGRAFTSTSDFPAILADAAHKAVIAGAQEAAETFDQWTGEVTATDFRAHTGVSLEAFSSLDLVPEDSEYKHGEITDHGITYIVATYGKLFGISRQAIVNDDVNAFTLVPAAMGRAAMRTAGDAVYNILIKNPQMPDGNALFSPAHNNLAAAGAAINAASFGAGITAMGTQKGKQGEALNIAAAYLLHAVARRAEAYTLLHSMVIGTQEQPNQANPWQNSVQPVAEARLDLLAGGAWFLCGPKGWGINTAWLGGNKTPRVEQRQGWTIDGTEFKVSIDFGCYVQDWRALYKNPGA